VKIFVSYSRRDARDFAEQISETLEDEHDVFTDIDDIEAGDIWTNVIEDNISRCDVFLVILTFASLRSSEVEKEVIQAQKKSKKIIPCVDRGIDINQLKWDLGKFQGIEFSSKYELAREVYRKIQRHQQNPPKEEPLVPPVKVDHSVPPVKEQPSVPPVKEQPLVPPVKVDHSVLPVKEQPSVQPVKVDHSVQPVKEKRSKPTKLILLSAAIVSIILVLLLTYDNQIPVANDQSITTNTDMAVNQIPVANDQSITTNTDTDVEITLSATDTDNNDLTAAIVDKPRHGSLSSINQATGAITYKPNSGFDGSDKFTFKVNDGKADSNIGTVRITVK
jgi:TIR domain-containing protein/Big-like domain-containing protein